MPILKKSTMILTLLTLSTIVWIGCSDNTIVRFVDGPGEAEQTEAVEAYFPLESGYTTIYNVTYSSGNSEQVTFHAGNTTSIRGVEVVEWIGQSLSSLDTGYFYASGDALYYYASVNSSPEKILQLPLVTGTAWAVSEVNSDDFTDIITGIIIDSTDPGILNKDFPTISATNFTVEETEVLVLGSGVSYSQAVRISSLNGSRKNYYWYAPGIGLVRYVIGASVASYPNGEVVGELSNYGF